MVDTQQAGRSAGLSVRTDTVDGIFVVTVAGEVDHQTGSPLRQALDITDGVPPRIVVDLRQVSFMDSSGINILIAVHHDLARANGWLRLAGAVPSVRRTIQLVGLDMLVDCYPSLPQALTG
ncbi:STAS domain-containing protein [Streptomyces hokutonensis]|uniref:STAS domain-containing protein n=1 Tax=Streptomyces hokutonensis TaxID=1306990 RepID=UPI00036E46D5|nr:STAS domain-containing protein [Streptomyces hokutonensis]